MSRSTGFSAFSGRLCAYSHVFDLRSWRSCATARTRWIVTPTASAIWPFEWFGYSSTMRASMAGSRCTCLWAATHSRLQYLFFEPFL
jgi:hypothetical protein